MPLRLYNTLTRAIEELTPERDGLVRLYTCGPTVYNHQHAGNYRTYVFEDLLKRGLKLLGYRVRHVMNITDVGHLTSQADEGEDKMEVGAAREGKTAEEIAEFYTKAFRDDIAKLRVDFKPVADPARADRPVAEDILCKATDYIPEQQRMVDRLIEKGFTYETSDGVYFDTAKFPAYGALAGAAHLAGIQEGARVAMGEKRNPTDFALWKFSPAGKKRQMEWDYRGRPGFPGWHIECTAMGQTYLGERFDLHCGGVDHIPIHHSNEIAQAEAATGKAPFVRVWLHGEFLLMNKAKMAKSEGGFITLAELERRGYDPLDYRYFCFGGHYRKQLDFSWEALDAAKAARRRLREFVRMAGAAPPGPNLGAPGQGLADFKAALADDLNAPNALACVHSALTRLDAPGAIEFLREAERVLALGLFDEDETLPPELQELFDGYREARARKDFAASDALRKRLAQAGVRVKDTKEGSRWVRG